MRKKSGGKKSGGTVPLKGQCREIFLNFLFHESKPSGPLINSLKWFCGDIREKFDSSQANTVQSRTLRRLTLRGVGK